MLDQVTPSHALRLRVRQQPAHHVQLMKPRPDLPPLLPAAPGVLRFNQLRVILQNLRQPRPRQNPPPQVIRLQSVRIRRIARAIVPALVKRQKPRGFPPQMRAKINRVIVHRKMRHAPPELEQPLARFAVAFVLLDGIRHRLLGQAVFQLEGGHRQPVDEQAQVQRALRLVAAVTQLPRHAEAVGGKPRRRLRVARRGRAVKQIERVRAMLQPVPQHVNHAAPAHLPLQPRQKLAAHRPVRAELQRLRHLRLCRLQKRRQLREIHAVFAVIVLRPPHHPTRAIRSRPLPQLTRRCWFRLAGRTGQHRANQPLQTAL